MNLPSAFAYGLAASDAQGNQNFGTSLAGSLQGIELERERRANESLRAMQFAGQQRTREAELEEIGARTGLIRAQTRQALTKVPVEQSIDLQAFNFYRSQGLTPVEARKKVLLDAAATRPEPSSEDKRKYQEILSKVIAEEGPSFDPSSNQAKLFSTLMTSKSLTPEEKQFAGAFLTSNPTPQAAITKVELGGAGKQDARLDRSFQYNASRLDKMSEPIDNLSARLGRLIDSVDIRSPQADSLIAPELLTVMAGGMGSGLRMNEAEIARIIGGRSNWETLQAKLNKWAVDPREALSVTGPQRDQIKALAQTVADKIHAKQAILAEAQDELNGSNSVQEHRRIVSGVRQKLAAIDRGESVSPVARQPVRVGGKAIPVNSDGTFEFGGHTYKVNPDGKGGTLVK